MVYPRIVSTDVNGLWLLAEWHEVKPQRPVYHNMLWVSRQGLRELVRGVDGGMTASD